jgi:ribonuclease BN (tRNA processing enzyme)
VDGVKVSVHYLNHTCVCLAYRIEADGKSFVYATDTEPHGLVVTGLAPPEVPGRGEPPHLVHEQDRRLAEFVAGADLLVMDAQYTDEEYPQRVGWGHCTTSYTTDIAVQAGVKRLALYHHDPMRRDDMVDEIVSVSGRRLASYGTDIDVFGAAEGQSVEL